jgi:hypothetical protein
VGKIPEVVEVLAVPTHSTTAAQAALVVAAL